MTNLLTDVSTLTTISEKTLSRLVKKVNYCICENVAEDLLKGVGITELDIGIGKLYIKHEANEIRYKFIPSDALNNDLINTVLNGKNILSEVLNDSIAKKFEEVYKDLC